VRRKLYGFASYALKDSTGGFFYRRPGVSQLLPLRLADGTIYDPRSTLYPAGFTPQFSGEVTDYAVYGGMRGELAGGFTVDVSASYGNDRIDYRIANTLNPSLGPDTPTRFRPGSLVNDEVALNADFTFPVDVGLRTPANVAFGLERRVEGYAIERGDPASFRVGPFARPDPFDLEVTQAEVDADPNDAVTTVACRIPGFEARGSPCPTSTSKASRLSRRASATAAAKLSPSRPTSATSPPSTPWWPRPSRPSAASTCSPTTRASPASRPSWRSPRAIGTPSWV
jgi:hypothetical protein